MKRYLFAAAFIGLANSAEAEPSRITLLERRLEFELPPGFIEANNRNNGTNVLIEYVGQGETLDNWTRLVTIQAYRGLGRSPASTAEIARQAFYPTSCRVGPIFHVGTERTIAPGLRQTVVANGCASLPAGAYPSALRGAGEQDFILIFRDVDTIYTLNYAVRGAPFAAGSPPIQPESGEDLMRRIFGAIRLNRGS